MRTPAGRECPYYYEDFHRGRSTQECRLLARNPHAGPWEPKLCARCPVPDIRQANACPHMILHARVVKRWLGLVRRVDVRASCPTYGEAHVDPYAGCGHCHEQAPSILDAQVSEEE